MKKILSSLFLLFSVTFVFPKTGYTLTDSSSSQLLKENFYLKTDKVEGPSVDFIYQDFEKAKAVAKAEKKYIIVDVYADWCGWCKKMDATTFKNDEVSNFINTNMIALKINSDKGKGPEFASKYGVSGLPTIVYLDYQGNLVKVAPGYKNASQLLNEIQPYKQKRSLKGEEKSTMNSYFKQRIEYQKKLKERLNKGEDTLVTKAMELGEKKKTFDFDQFKYQKNKTLTPEGIAKLDVFYLIGKKEYARAFEKLKEEKLAMKFSKTQTEFLVYMFVFNGLMKTELLEMVNEISTGSKDIELLNTKALLQYLIGDKLDSKSTIKRIKKLSKKQKVDLSPSLKTLEGIV